ncbi:MAG: hypothetical protein JWP12_46 [Bacteroidetes bacterium]|nr:hypothetical protein [Bacteroidota bacterium]
MIKKLLLISFVLTFNIAAKAQTRSTIVQSENTDFETNASLVEIDTAASNIWQIGLPQKMFFGTPSTPPFAIMTDTINSYPINNHSTFTVSMDSSVYGFFPNAAISFWHKYETDSLQDGGYVEFSADSGHTWTNVVDTYSMGVISIEPTNFYNNYTHDTIQGGIYAFTGTQNTWQYSRIKLSWFIAVLPTYNGSGINRDLNYVQKIMFRFNFKSDGVQTNKAGWIIDNIVIDMEDLGGGIAENKQSSFDVKLFPNPVENQSIMQIIPSGDDKNFSLSIYNATGQLVSKNDIDRNNQFIINKSDLNSGIYFYSVTSSKGVCKNGKLIIQ